MKRCSYCAGDNLDGLFLCRHCGADLAQPLAASRGADLGTAEAVRPSSSEQAASPARPPGMPFNIGGILVGAGVLLILAGRLFGEGIMGMGWLSAFIGLVSLLKGKSTKARYGGAFALSIIMLAVLMPEKEEPEPGPASGVADQVDRAPSDTASATPQTATTEIMHPTSAPAPDAPVAAPAQPVRHRKSIGLRYAEVMSYLSNAFAMEAASPVDGLDRYMGQSEEGLAILEVIGDRRDIAQASLVLALPNDAPDAVVINSAILMRFLKNTFPKWKNAEKWVLATVRKSIAAGATGASTTRGKRTLDVQVLAEMGMLVLTVRHREDR